MPKATNEIFNIIFEEAIVPLVDKIMEEDHKKILKGKNELCENEMEFVKFKNAFEQRIKLFYFRQFTQYKKEGIEKMFPIDMSKVKEDINFLYVDFKAFLKMEREKLEK